MYEEGAREIACSVVSGINCKYKVVLHFDIYHVKVSNEQVKTLLQYICVQIPASIFAYGQTSSGKTYTMKGILEYSVADIFDYIRRVS